MGDWLKRHKIHVIGIVVAAFALSLIRNGGSAAGVPLVVFAALGALGAYLYFRPTRRLLSAVRKKHPDFTPSKSIQGVGKDSGLLLDEKKRSVVLYGSEGSGIFGYQKMIRSEIVEDGNSVTSTVRSSQLLRAAVGGALFGGVGAVAGAVTGKTRTQNEISTVLLVVTVNDPQRPVYTVEFLNEKKSIPKASAKAKKAIADARTAQALVAVLIKQADEDDRKSAPLQTAPSFANAPAIVLSDELGKLVALKEQGHLSESEFSEMKKTLTSKAAV